MRGKKTLEESLDFYCQGELMEGDNQYFCEEVGKKVTPNSSSFNYRCSQEGMHVIIQGIKFYLISYINGAAMQINQDSSRSTG